MGSFLADGYSTSDSHVPRWLSSARDEGAGACRNLPRPGGDLHRTPAAGWWTDSGAVGSGQGTVRVREDPVGMSERDFVRLATVSETPVDVAAVTALVDDDRAGALVTFCGVVRNHDGGRDVMSLGYSSHPSAEAVIRQIADEFRGREGVHALAVVHRVGDLAVGDVALLAVVAASHRGQAFSCCSDLVERVKESLPIWKHQRYTDGTADWSNLP